MCFFFGRGEGVNGVLIWEMYEIIYLDLPKGAKWFVKGANLPSLSVSLAPLIFSIILHQSVRLLNLEGKDSPRWSNFGVVGPERT